MTSCEVSVRKSSETGSVTTDQAFLRFGAGQNAVCSALKYSCYWMINAATQLNMEPITVSARQHVHDCVSAWPKFAALSCHVKTHVHIFSHGLHLF